MKEQELNTLMSVVSDPIKNVYKINSRKDLEEMYGIIPDGMEEVIIDEVSE